MQDFHDFFFSKYQKTKTQSLQIKQFQANFASTEVMVLISITAEFNAYFFQTPHPTLPTLQKLCKLFASPLGKQVSNILQHRQKKCTTQSGAWLQALVLLWYHSITLTTVHICFYYENFLPRKTPHTYISPSCSSSTSQLLFTFC